MHACGGAMWIFFCVSLLAAQNPPSISARKLPIRDSRDRVFVSISPAKGPSHAWVGQIVNDGPGFLWFATKDSLDRFDGYEIRHFSPDLGRGNNGVFAKECCRYALFSNRFGKMWIGADDSLYQYDPGTERFQRVPIRPGGLQGLVRNINEDKDGMLWLAASSGLTRYNPKTGEPTRFAHQDDDPATLGSNYVRSTLETTDGAFWVATNRSVDLFDRQAGKVIEHFPLRNPLRKKVTVGNPYVHLLQDHAGTLWVASARDGLAVIDRRENRLTFVSLSPDPKLDAGAWAIIEDKYGVLWVGTEYGLLSLDRDRKEFLRYRNDPSDIDSLPADWILGLYEDREGGMWAGMANAGVARFSAHPLPSRRYRRQGHDPFGTDYVLFAFEDSRGTIWEGTKGAINRIEGIDLKTGRRRGQVIGGDSQVGAITADKSGQLWVSTFDGSLFRFDPATRRTVTYLHGGRSATSCGNNEVGVLVFDRSGILWAGAANSLCSFNPATTDFREYKMDTSLTREINAIAEDRNGIFWIGARHGGLFSFDRATGKFTIFRQSTSGTNFRNEAVTSLLVDRSGSLWVGTLNGLNRLDVQTGGLTAYSMRDGLPSNGVNGILEDAEGDLWVNTDYGLSHLRRSSNSFYNYYRSDGVFDDLTGAWKGRPGELLFGSYSGLTVLTLTDLDERDAYSPPAVVTSIRISDQPVAVAAEPQRGANSNTKSLVLSYRQNSASFEFSALSYASPARTLYRYRLRNLESAWNEVTSTQRLARYTSLAPGRYVFEVEGQISRGGWPDRASAINLVVLPPWWGTTTFRIASVIAAGLIVWWVYRLRVYQMARQLDLTFQERLRERTRIAQDLHDTLLQNIAGLCLQIGALSKVVAASPDSARERLRDLRRQGEECLREARQAVWDIRSLESNGIDLISKLRESGEQLTLGTRTRFDFHVVGPARECSQFLGEQLLRIGREAIINAVRHARAEKVDLLLKFEAGMLRLRISDNGCGFRLEEAASLSGHFGLTTMRERARKIGAEFDISTHPNEGTRVEISVTF